MAQHRAVWRRILLPAFALAFAATAALGASQASNQATAQPRYQLLWLNGKPMCPAGSKLVTSPQGKPMCVAVQAQPH